MNTQNNLAWYYVGVGAVLLIGQSYLLNTAHKEQVAKLNAKLAAATATATAEASPAAAPGAIATAPAPVSTLAATPAAAPAAQAAPAPAPATAAPAVASAPVEKKVAEKKAAEPKTIVASAAPAAAPASSGKALPVAFQFRSEPFEKEKIVTLKNASKDKLDCKVTVVRPGSSASSSFKVTVAAASEARLTGGDKGWKFKTGDRIQVAQAGYKPASTSVP